MNNPQTGGRQSDITFPGVPFPLSPSLSPLSLWHLCSTSRRGGRISLSLTHTHSSSSSSSYSSCSAAHIKPVGLHTGGKGKRQTHLFFFTQCFDRMNNSYLNMASIGEFDPLNASIPATKVEITVSCR